MKWIEMGKTEVKPESYHLGVTRVGIPGNSLALICQEKDSVGED